MNVRDIFFRLLGRILNEYDRFKINDMKKRFKYCGNNVTIYQSCTINGVNFLVLGDNITINEHTHIYAHGGVTVGDNTLIAANCVISSVTHPITSKNRYHDASIRSSIVIGNNVWICAGAIILPGVTIGDNSIVGAGAVVTTDVPSNSIYAGVPAKLLKKIEF